LAKKLKKRQIKILDALVDLDGRATVKEIAKKAHLNVNGVSQTLSALSGRYVRYINGTGGDAVWSHLIG